MLELITGSVYNCRDKDRDMKTHELLQILACPKCLGQLTALEENGLTAGLACEACKLVYPVQEDIPVMLPEKAIERPIWDDSHPAARESI